jgi:fused signal recognition particle receptor
MQSVNYDIKVRFYKSVLSFYNMFKFLREKLKSAFCKITKKAEEEKEEDKEKLKEQLQELKKEYKEEEKEVKELKETIKEKVKEEKIAQEWKGKEIAKEIKEDIKETNEDIEKLENEISEDKKEGRSFLQKIKDKFITKKISETDFNEIFDQLEIVLLENNIALEVVEKIKEDLKYRLIDKTIKRAELEAEIREALKETLKMILKKPFNLIERIRQEKNRPFVMAFFGINGAGKTTSIAKIAHLLKKNKLSCVIAAADTFRAASIEQLEKHGAKLNVEIVKHQYGADPAAVAFDAIKHAKANRIDVVLIDTAGRMHTKTDLMREMEKIIRVAKPDLKIFVGEAITGNDVIEQGIAFNKQIGIDGIILAKADIDERGGSSISISFITKKPVLYLGMGQEYDDLEIFEPEKIIKSIID